MDDAAIVALFWARSEDAIREAEKRYGSYCAAIAGRILSDPEDTRECLNDLWLAVWRSIPPQRPENLRCYLGKLIRNLAISRRRSTRRQKRGGGETELVLEELGECVSGGTEPEQALEARVLCEALDRWLAALPLRDRQLFVNRYFYVRSVPELAETAGMSRANVNSTLYRLRKKLREYLEKEGLV